MEQGLACEQLAADQHGVLSREQAISRGLSPRAIDRRVAARRWQVIHTGVYAPVPVRSSWLQSLMAAVLCGGPSAFASHRAAAALRQLDGVNERLVEISVKAGRQIRGAVVHRRGPGDDPTVVVLDGIPATGLERTLLDLTAVVSPRRAGLALDDALRRRSTTLDAMREMLSASRGRPGTRTLRRLLDARDDRDGTLESRLESDLLHVLRKHGLPIPVPQLVVTDGDIFVARLDFAYPAFRLGIEADGYWWHTGVDRWRDDLRRENRLKLLGWTILRFSWEDVHDRPEYVASQVRSALSHFQPSLS
jgi:very-short-patch-repair endonuclease